MNTIEAAHGAYLAELKRYVDWTEGRKRVYGANSNPMETWGGSDWRRVNEWAGKLRGMEEVLGLTEAEVEAAIDQIKAAA